MEQTFMQLIGDFGYLGIFAALLLGIIGLPIPDEILMTFVGYMVHIKLLSYEISVLSASMGAICGVSINYLLGKHLGLPFLKKAGPYLLISASKIEKAQRIFQKYDVFVIFFSYYVSGLRYIAAFLAGVSQIKFRKFMLVAYTGASLWCFVFITAGKILGPHWLQIQDIVHLGIFIPLLLTAIVIIFMAVLMVKKKKSKNNENSSQNP